MASTKTCMNMALFLQILEDDSTRFSEEDLFEDFYDVDDLSFDFSYTLKNRFCKKRYEHHENWNRAKESNAKQRWKMRGWD